MNARSIPGLTDEAGSFRQETVRSPALREIFPAASPRRTLLPLSATRLFLPSAPSGRRLLRSAPCRASLCRLFALPPSADGPLCGCRAPRFSSRPRLHCKHDSACAPLFNPPPAGAAVPSSMFQGATSSEIFAMRFLWTCSFFPATSGFRMGRKAFAAFPGKSLDFPFRRLTFLKAVYIRISRYRVISKGRHDGILSRTSRRTHVQGRNNSRTGLPSYLIHAGKKPVRQARAFSFLFTSSCRISRFRQDPCPAGTTDIQTLSPFGKDFP